MLANDRFRVASPSIPHLAWLLIVMLSVGMVGCANEAREGSPQAAHDESAKLDEDAHPLSKKADVVADPLNAAQATANEVYASQVSGDGMPSASDEGPYTADLEPSAPVPDYPSSVGSASSPTGMSSAQIQSVPRTKFTLPSNPKYLTSPNSISSANSPQYAPETARDISPEMLAETNSETAAAAMAPQPSASASIPPSFQSSASSEATHPRRFGSAAHLPDLAEGAQAVEKLEEDRDVAKAAGRPSVVGAAASDVSVANSPEYETLKVYFATDREATADLLPGPLRLFGPAALACIAFCGLGIGLMLARRLRFLWLTATIAASAMCVFIGQATLVRWQQLDRLATDASSAFTTSRFEVGNGKYPLHVGQARLTIPANHQKGKVESASILKLEFVETPSKHIVLQSVRIEEQDSWYASIAEDVATESDNQSPPLSSGRGAFVFVHGYNVRFDAALKRTAQLATDLGIEGPAICFSWPSLGQIAGYTADESTVNWSAPHFEQLILDLRDKAKVKSINIVAHSMGNRALLQAVERIGMRIEAFNQAVNQFAATEQVEKPKIIDQLIMAAPDVDARTFTGRYTKYLDMIAEHSTMYFSADDRALWLSELLHGGSRVGLSGTLASLDGIDAVDIGSQKLLSFGHSYYGSDPAVIDDLAAVLLKHQRPRDRGWLKQEQTDAGAYWKLDRVRHAQLSSPLLR